MTLTAPELVTALRRSYGCEHDGIGPEWAALDEMAIGVGGRTPRIDLLCIRAWGGRPKGHERHAIEIKTSRSDLRRELDKGKWRPWAVVTHRFYLAIPGDLDLTGIDLPERWGLLRGDTHGVHVERRAPRQDDPGPLPEPVALEAFRRASRAEARIRQADDGDPQARAARLHQENTALHRTIETARRGEERWQQRAESALEMWAAFAPDVRCQCGTPIKISPFGRSYSLNWEHTDQPGPDPMSLRASNRACRYPRPDLERLAQEVAA